MEKALERTKRVYYRLTGNRLKPPKTAIIRKIVKCAFLFVPTLRARRQQDHTFVTVKSGVLKTKRLMVFLFPPDDVVSGGHMSICNIIGRSKQMANIHNCTVLASTMPGFLTIHRLTKFENDLELFRFSEIRSLLPYLEEVFMQIPEMLVLEFDRYLKKHPKLLSHIPVRRLNIINQNVELMPAIDTIQHIRTFFTDVTQTCGHEKCFTQQYRDLYQMPLHLLTPQIPGLYYQYPYEEKENLIAYSNDEHPMKEQILARIQELLPDYRMIKIENMTFDEYKKIISRAKWTLTFGEGWDGYFLEPYASNSVGFTVFHEAFCPERMRYAPSVFPDYETLPERMRDFIHNYDNKDAYYAVIDEVRRILFPPPPESDVVVAAKDQLEDFYQRCYAMEPDHRGAERMD